MNLSQSNRCERIGHGAYLWGSDLSGANLAKAKLWGAANLSGVKLNEANLRGAKLNYAKLYGANLTGAYYDEHQMKMLDSER